MINLLRVQKNCKAIKESSSKGERSDFISVHRYFSLPVRKKTREREICLYNLVKVYKEEIKGELFFISNCKNSKQVGIF